MRSVLVAPPAEEPVSLAEAKLWARIDGPDEDDLVASLITAARVAAEDYTRRAFVTQTWRATLDTTGGGRVPDWLPAGTYNLPVNHFDGDLPRDVLLPRQPVRSVTEVLTYDADAVGTPFAAANYHLADARLIVTAAWPGGLRGYDSAAITYVCGYGDAAAVPEPIKTAIKMHVLAMYESRTACDLPAGCAQLLRQYRVMAA